MENYCNYALLDILKHSLVSFFFFFFDIVIYLKPLLKSSLQPKSLNENCRQTFSAFHLFFHFPLFITINALSKTVILLFFFSVHVDSNDSTTHIEMTNDFLFQLSSLLWKTAITILYLLVSLDCHLFSKKKVFEFNFALKSQDLWIPRHRHWGFKEIPIVTAHLNDAYLPLHCVSYCLLFSIISAYCLTHTHCRHFNHNNFHFVLLFSAFSILQFNNDFELSLCGHSISHLFHSFVIWHILRVCKHLNV